MKKKIIIISIIAVLLIAVSVFSIQKKAAQPTVLDSTAVASTTDLEIPQGYYPENFFSFEYEQNAFKGLRDQSLKSLVANPVRYCGEGWYHEYGVFGDSDFTPQPGEVFDCKEFGTGNSFIKRISQNSQAVENGPDKGRNLKTVSAYTIGKYKMTEDDAGEIFSEVSDKSCRIKITDGSKEVFKIESDEYSCGSVDSVEQNGRALLSFGGFSSGGNSYAGDEHYLFYDGSTLHDIGGLVRQGYGSENVWIQNGDFVFWVYDGRYESSFRGSHNASTYAFIPRVFKISAKNGGVEITEGPSISPSIKEIYQHQLNAIRESFATASNDETSHGQAALDPFIAYWAGISRYLLNGVELTSELNKIANTQKEFALEAPYNGDLVDQLYKDIKSGVIKGLK
jgi:hypothetical protein